MINVILVAQYCHIERVFIFACVQTANKKAELLRQVDAQHQYEKLLEQYEEFLATAENKIKSDEISAVNLPALKQQSDEHKASKDYENNSGLKKTIKLSGETIICVGQSRKKRKKQERKSSDH